MAENRNLTEQEKREIRRKRRIKNQILAYISLAVLILLILGAAALAVTQLKKLLDKGKAPADDVVIGEVVEDLIEEEEEIPTPEPEPTAEPVIELTEEQKLDEIINALIEVMPLEDRVAGLFITTPEGITGVNTALKAGEGTKKALAEHPVGGIIYAKKNISNASQFKEMIENTKLYSSYPLFLAVAEEPGNGPLAATGLAAKSDNAQTIGQNNDGQAAYAAGIGIATAMADLGLNLNLGIIADMAVAEGSIVEKRSYGTDATVAGQLAYQFHIGLDSMGIDTCTGHFPGIGNSIQDPAKGPATVNGEKEVYDNNEFYVFGEAIGAGTDMIMTANVSAPGLSDDGLPATLSEKIITGILREELRYDGVVITAPMNEAAIANYYASDEAAVMALRAGCDMILMPENFEKAYNGVLEAVANGTVSEERINDSLRRVYRIKYADKLEQ